MSQSPPGMTTVPDVKPATVTTKHAWRIVIGRFIVRYVETFAGLIGAQVVILLAAPETIDWKNVAVQFLAPALTAGYQAARAAWPGISGWLSSGGADDPLP